MAHGNYPSSGYRNDRSRGERDFDRESQDYRPGDTGYVRPSRRFQRTGDDLFAGNEEPDRSRSSRDWRGEQWAQDDFGYDEGYGDSERSRAWARESYRARPTGLHFEPGRNRDRMRSPSEERYGAGQRRRFSSSDYGDEDVGYRGGYGQESRDRSRGTRRDGDEYASLFGDEDVGRRAMDEHRGKGPRGYKRSDARIEEDLNDRLSDDPALDASDISVTVKEGEVTLDGFVATRWDKRHAEDVADDISGVGHVQNNLRIRPGGGGLASGPTTV